MIVKTPTGYITGTYDVLAIIKNVATGRFHVYLLRESRLPGTGHKDPDELPSLRFKSFGADEYGRDTYEGALEVAAKWRERLEISDDNVWTKPEQVFERDCSAGFAAVLFAKPWKGRPELPKLSLEPDAQTLAMMRDEVARLMSIIAAGPAATPERQEH